MAPDLTSWAWKDKEEFAYAHLAGFFTPTRAARILDIARQVIAQPLSIWHPSPRCGWMWNFTSLSSWLSRRPATPAEGPRHDEIGMFVALIARLGPGHKKPLEADILANMDVVAFAGLCHTFNAPASTPPPAAPYRERYTLRDEAL